MCGEYAYLEVAMHDALVVHVVDCLEHLSDQVGRILFCVRTLFDDAIEQFATRDAKCETQQKR